MPVTNPDERLHPTLDDGSSWAIEGLTAGHAVPVRPAPDQPVVVHEAPMRFSTEGRTGFGIYEHLVTQYD